MKFKHLALLCVGMLLSACGQEHFSSTDPVELDDTDGVSRRGVVNATFFPNTVGISSITSTSACVTWGTNMGAKKDPVYPILNNSIVSFTTVMSAGRYCFNGLKPKTQYVIGAVVSDSTGKLKGAVGTIVTKAK